MQCGCEIESGYDGCGPSCFSATTPLARRAHKCGECGGEIKPGERYKKESGLWESGFQTQKTCLDCISLRDVFFCDFLYGEVLSKLCEHIEESEGEVLSSAVAKLTPRAQAMLFDMIEDYWVEYAEEHPVEPAQRLQTRKHKLYWRTDWARRRFAECEQIGNALWDGPRA